MKIRVDSYNAPEGRRKKNSELPDSVVTASSDWFEVAPKDADLLETLLHKHFGEHYQVVHQLDISDVQLMVKEKRGRKKTK